jgi:hypothetical protein
MKTTAFALLLSLILQSCQNNQETKVQTSEDTIVSMEEKKEVDKETIQPKQSLALTLNALQLVDKSSGSTTEIAFGKPLDEMVEIVNNILQSKTLSIEINSECGAGPLKMAMWSNGLTLLFEENEEVWQFAGWSASSPTNTLQKLTTMSGIGVGSTRAELESAYTTKVFKSTLGTEFSISDGLFGILSGTSKDAKITDMWSGVSCNFR